MSAMYNTYDLGDLIRLDTEIKISGSYVDPNHLLLTVQSPAGIDYNFIYGQTGTFVKFGIGKYYLDYFANETGQYAYRFFASGTAWGAEEKNFVVRLSKV